jgi:phosphoglycolate phosphatase
MMPRLVIFDVDGTLVDSQEIIVAAQRAAFAAHGLPAPERQESLSVVGLSLIEAFRALAGPAAPVESLAEAYKKAFHALRADPANHEPFFPGALETVRTLAARDDVLLGIATGKSRRGVAHILDRAQWTGLFATVQTADDHPSKPAPDMILAALAETSVEPNRAIMVGDTTFDMIMAKDADIAPLGVAWGYHPAQALLGAGAIAIAQTFADVLAHVHAMEAQRAAHA